jgi:hypothetical protein
MSPGVHAPAQAPLAQACEGHGVGVPQLPPEHVCTEYPEHCVAPSVHVPEHAPLAHMPLSQVTSSSHSPVAEQICTPMLSAAHWALPGAQTPVQAPLTHAWLVQGTPAPQFPVSSQVSRPSVAHCLEVLAHTPMHAPLEQVCVPQSAGVPQWPELLQVWTPLPEHWVALGVQVAPASPFVASSPVEPPSSPAAWSTVASLSVPPDDEEPPPSPVWPESLVSVVVEGDPAHAARTTPEKTRVEA